METWTQGAAEGTWQEFTCPDFFDAHRCVPAALVCDGISHCSGERKENRQNKLMAADEWYVSQGGPCEDPPICPPGSFQCKDGNNTCIPDVWECDKRPDCPDLSDEADGGNDCEDVGDPRRDWLGVKFNVGVKISCVKVHMPDTKVFTHLDMYACEDAVALRQAYGKLKEANEQ